MELLLKVSQPNLSNQERLIKTPFKYWRPDIQHDDIQHSDTQHKGLICETQHKRHSA
jgi:hypothetical protein